MKLSTKTYSLRLLPLSLIASIVVIGIPGLVSASCRRTPATTLRTLDHVQEIIENHPDSALSLIKSIDTLTLRSDADRARYSLLRTMALDKNYLPLTDPEIIRPALDYHLKHGTPDQRMRTRYYEGVTYYQNGDDVNAMECFLDAIADTTAVYTDSLGLALVYIGQGATYWKQSRLYKFIELNHNAVNIYKSRGDSVRTALGLARILAGEIRVCDTLTVGRTLKDLKNYLPIFSDIPDNVMATMLWGMITTGLKSQDTRILDSVYNSGNNNPEVMLAVAAGYQKSGNIDRALGLIDKIQNLGTPYDTIHTVLLRSECYEKSGDYHKALNLYQDFYSKVEDDYNSVLSNDLLFTRQKFDINAENALILHKKDQIILGVTIGILLSLVLILLVLLGYKNQRNKTQALNREYNLAKQSLESQQRVMTELQYNIDNLGVKNADLSENLLNLSQSNMELKERLQTNLEKTSNLIDSFIKKKITGKEKYNSQLENLMDEIDVNREEFLKLLKEYLEIFYPNFITYISGLDLTDAERNWTMLYAIGLSGTEIETYMKLKGFHVSSSGLRKKLRLSKDDKYLAEYIPELKKRLNETPIISSSDEESEEKSE